MQVYWTLVRREIGAHFLAWSGYIVVAATVFLLGLSFMTLIELLGDEPTHRPITELLSESYMFWLILILAPPVITMRSFALEKSTGTFETLMTAPVRDTSVVLAKFTGAMVVYTVLWLPLLPCLWLIRHFGRDPMLMDPGAVGSVYLGILLLGCVLVSMGCLASALTRSQTVAAILSFGASIAMLMLSFLALGFSGDSTVRGQLLSQVGLIEHMQDFSSGVIDTRPLVLYVTLTVFFLFFTKRVVESRRWK